MDKPKDFNSAIDQILKENDRYKKGAYFFVREALDFTIKEQLKATTGKLPTQHITGQNLLRGIREFALQQFGPLTLTVLADWNVKNCKDFGVIVFNMIDYGILGKTAQDSIEDFAKGYDFQKTFGAPFAPISKTKKKSK